MSEPHAGTGWEQRWHPLLQEWIILSAHRQDRPWTGERNLVITTAQSPHDPDCFLCPRNRRINGTCNPDYRGIHVFDNDRPSLSFTAPTKLPKPAGIYRNRPATGLTRVLCYSPLHNTSMAQLDLASTRAVIGAWQQQTRELGAMDGINSVMIFENKGELCGMSNPHPHGQVYATNFRYKSTDSHLAAAAEHERKTGRILFQDVLDAERNDGSRIVAENDTMIAFVPYFARFAYEVYVSPRRTVQHVHELSDNESSDLAGLLRQVLVRMDNLWQLPFPYWMVVHQAPTDGKPYPLYHFHISLYPPLRKPDLRKHVAAHEIGAGNFLADTLPEVTAAQLRASSAEHYLLQGN
jgi:UDPglucose--hexose-1-phosphate uridylyltransferase